MLVHLQRFVAAATILPVLCATALGAHGRVCGPYGVPCVPQRVTYGYFPTNWRRWPIEAMPVIQQQPEALPTPAPEPAAPKTTPEAEQPPFGEKPLEPSPPLDAAPLTPPGQEPMTPPGQPGIAPPPDPFAPPGQEGQEPPPAMPDAKAVFPPLEDEPLVPPGTTAPKLDDAPPSLPGETAPTAPSGAAPAEGMPELPPGQPTPIPGDGDAPPKMPDDDPFKDDPEGPPTPPAATPKPEAGTRLQQPALSTQAARWRIAGAAAQPVQATPASVAVNEPEPARLPTADGPAQLPRSSRANPLRSASRQAPKAQVVPAAASTAPSSSITAGEEPAWRRNPLRSN
jgi:hypothetical protein